MVIREVSLSERTGFNAVVNHPLQSWEWGEFRQKTGVKVIRLGAFEGNKLVQGYQVTIHIIPKTSMNVAYFPKGDGPDEMQLEALKKIGRDNNCLFIKLEPNVQNNENIRQFLLDRGCREGRPLFTKFTFEIDLTKSEEELLAAMKPKTRYNIGVAQRYGVQVGEEKSPQAVEEFVRLTAETTKRQGFYAHDEKYQRLMWETLAPTGMARMLVARWQGRVLATWVVLVFNGVIYYPYGASSAEHREVMASNVMMWEVIRLGKRLGCKMLDMWGALGPEPNEKDPWYGFHRFKEGYGGQLVEFVGTFDLVLKPSWYGLYRIAEEGRWMVLRWKARLI
jgi:lipid II:glycine glycyltransferase (peptidoglycan interpeptide bridge formation enzyme)